MVVDRSKGHGAFAHHFQRQRIADKIQIECVVQMAVQIALGITRRPLPCAGQTILALVQLQRQLVLHRIVPEILHRPARLPQDTALGEACHDPAAVHHCHLFALGIGKCGDAFDGTVFADLRPGGKGQRFGTLRHAVKFQGLLAHQKGHAAFFEELVIHTKGAGVVCRNLLHIAQQSAGLEQAAEVCVCIHNGHRFRVKILFHGFPSFYKKGCRTLFCAAASFTFRTCFRKQYWLKRPFMQWAILMKTIPQY